MPQQGRDIVQRRRSVASLHEGTGRRFQYSRPALFLAAESRLGFPQEIEIRLAFVGRWRRHFFSTERGLNWNKVRWHRPHIIDAIHSILIYTPKLSLATKPRSDGRRLGKESVSPLS